MDGTGDRCYENFGRNFTFCGFMMFVTPSVLSNEVQKEFPEEHRVAGADSGAVEGEDELAAAHPVVDGLAADLDSGLCRQVFTCSVFVGKTVQFSMAIYRYDQKQVLKHMNYSPESVD